MSFKFKTFEEMTSEDYADIGFMSGLEVHQQLLTHRKLFCRCPAGSYRYDYDAEVLRHMRPTLSELGEYDGTALMEKKTKKNIYYRIHHDTVCTYEFDDTPPFFPDDNAIDISIQICMMCHLNLVGEMHIARKQYLDGSIPTGFQRTAILGVTGWVPYKDRRVAIRQLSLEEDSCREVSDIGHDRVYLTDRLGMPLIELVTEPDMRTPQEVAEVNNVLRMILRSTGKVRTGYGATRQDVNVSVRGGTRVEIKGVPQISRIPLLVYNEAQRQCSLLNIRKILHERGVKPETFECSSHDVTRILAKSPYQPIQEALAEGHRVRCTVLKGFGGLLTHPTQEHTTFAKEFSDRVRVIACLSKLPNIAHSDAASDLLTVRDWKEIRKKVKAGEQDVMVLVWGSEEDTQCACSEIAIRAKEATEGVPSDTRQAHKDGTTGFERVLPGPERMYPDTDLPPIELTETRIGRIREGLPTPYWEREQRYRELGLPEDVIEPLCRSSRCSLFDRVVDEMKVDASFAAVVLCQRFKAFERDGLSPENLTDEEIAEVFEAYASGKLAREGVVEVLERLLKDAATVEFAGSRTAAALTAVIGDRPATAAEVNGQISEFVAAAKREDYADAATMHRHLMGAAMREFIGRYPGRGVSELLAKKLNV